MTPPLTWGTVLNPDMNQIWFAISVVTGTTAITAAANTNCPNSISRNTENQVMQLPTTAKARIHFQECESGTGTILELTPLMRLVPAIARSVPDPERRQAKKVFLVDRVHFPGND